MSERDELKQALKQGGAIDVHAESIADAILAAGYRKVPDDCVVVRRSVIDWMLDDCSAGEIYFGHFGGDEVADNFLDDVFGHDTRIEGEYYGDRWNRLVDTLTAAQSGEDV